jgi:hypothetical protein
MQTNEAAERVVECVLRRADEHGCSLNKEEHEQMSTSLEASRSKGVLCLSPGLVADLWLSLATV